MVRLRLIGGALTPGSLRALAQVAATFGDDSIHLTKRANLQLRALPAGGGRLDPDVITAIEATGLLPVPSHELVRNVLVSPLTGLVGGRLDLRPIALALDEGLCAEPVYAGLSARFLFVLDDGRGDVIDRSCDLGLGVLDSSTAQLRIGDGWGPVVPIGDAVPALLELSEAFVAARGTGPGAPWHVSELTTTFHDAEPRDPRTQLHGEPPAYGLIAPGVEHVEVAAGRLDADFIERLLARDPAQLVVTPWRSLIACS